MGWDQRAPDPAPCLLPPPLPPPALPRHTVSPAEGQGHSGSRRPRETGQNNWGRGEKGKGRGQGDKRRGQGQKAEVGGTTRGGGATSRRQEAGHLTGCGGSGRGQTP